jgi:hypothetical protein
MVLTPFSPNRSGYICHFNCLFFIPGFIDPIGFTDEKACAPNFSIYTLKPSPFLPILKVFDIKEIRDLFYSPLGGIQAFSLHS